ncbi:MAG: zf-HC2 domain-containing protein [Lachnospiraceae bacterium]|nr:zf-HC2 domain-containing protein [Lachnospiraceae bacterium]MBP5298590.1 zf-HC2 domain-containing protein [Lachnospiraceae bacterium]
MTCKEAERLIPVFIENQLNYRELEKFLEHIKTCPACMEEMSVQFLVAEGMKRLEDGGSLELEGELKNLLADSKRALSRHRLFWRIGLGLEFGAVIVMLVMLVVYLI